MASFCLHATAAPLASRRAACAAGSARLAAAPRPATCRARGLSASPRAAITLGPLDTHEPMAPFKWCARRGRRAGGARGARRVGSSRELVSLLTVKVTVCRATAPPDARTRRHAGCAACCCRWPPPCPPGAFPAAARRRDSPVPARRVLPHTAELRDLTRAFCRAPRRPQRRARA
jgi:hypothetical protein